MNRVLPRPMYAWGEGWGEGHFVWIGSHFRGELPLTLTLSPEYRGEGTRGRCILRSSRPESLLNFRATTHQPPFALRDLRAPVAK